VLLVRGGKFRWCNRAIAVLIENRKWRWSKHWRLR
jgi:hypothetical protein